MASNHKIQSEPISDSEFHRLFTLYKQRGEPKRSAERVDRPIIVKPSEVGARVVNWAQYLELVGQGTAKYPPFKGR